tara:strand:- start:505 stop:702 length:198 start_codon:yes stop_codon:yes gene_type:complete
MAKKVYILTVEFDENDEQIEYIQEEVMDKSDLEEQAFVSLTEEDYWDKDSIEILKQFYSGEIGES